MSEQAKKILIVEDEKPLGRALSLKLGKAGYQSDNAYDGEDALTKLKNGKYDLVLLDLVMPKLNGFEVLVKKKEAKDNTPVIVLSNLSQEDDVKRTKEFGVLDFIIKSDMSIFDIIEKIKKIV
ncbi:MAG: response regulator [Patescibacteria group bacterium]|nr:response regulator [Patescibacteria group bacterium]MDD4611118.1 response regulator [Patescibacteria group bacterium]